MNLLKNINYTTFRQYHLQVPSQQLPDGQKIQGQPRLCAMSELLFPNSFCCCLKRNRPVAPSTQQKPLVCWDETVLLYNPHEQHTASVAAIDVTHQNL